MWISPRCFLKYFSDFSNVIKNEATVYFHWPFCKNLCSFCNFNKYVKSEKRYGTGFDEKMETGLLKETFTVLGSTSIKRIKSIYFGGGTPSLAPISTLAKLINNVKELCYVEDTAEITIECNPSSLNMTETLEEYKSIGINRVSVGLQSVNDKTLKILGRDHSAKDGIMLLQNALNILGNDAVSVDLLFRKPSDTVSSWKEELSQIIEFKPSHISLYELTPEKGTPLFKQIKSGVVMLPDTNDNASMYHAAIELLKLSNYDMYEVSNFVRSGSAAESIHNMSYWDGTQYVGIGPGAHSRIFPLDSTMRESRVQCLDPKLWYKMVEKDGHATVVRKKQSDVDVLSELLVTSMRTTKGIHPTRWNQFQKKWSLTDVFKQSFIVQELCASGKLRWGTCGNLHATTDGMYVIDAILPSLLNILQNISPKYIFNLATAEVVSSAVDAGALKRLDELEVELSELRISKFSMESSKLDEEKLREAACYGDLEAVQMLIKKGVNVNSQHTINGWTALHWAAKRNQLDVAHCLLTNGANKDLESFAKEIPADLSTSPAMLNLLGSPKLRNKAEETEGSIIPHYLAHPASGHKVEVQEQFNSPTVFLKREMVEPKELLFKLRIAYSTDTDFIEVEIERSELTFQHFMTLCCAELGLNPKYVERLRKLPNTRLRKDRDIQRLKDFDEIEVVLVGSKPKPTLDSDSVSVVGPSLKNQNQTILY